MQTLEITRTDAPGWLQRAWLEHLEDTEPREPRHDYMTRSRLAEILEPFARKTVDDDGRRHLLVDVDGIDAVAAAALLAVLPDDALEHDWSHLAPSPAVALAAVVRSKGAMTCGGDVVSPSLPMGGFRVRSLQVKDAALLDVEPDVVPLPLPDWLDELSGDDYVDYVRRRQDCLDHGRTRPAWVRVASRFAIDDARRFPHMNILTDDDGAEAGVRFSW